MSETQTKAEIRARRIGEGFERAGFDVEYKIEQHEAEYYTDGDVMIPSRTMVHVHVVEKGLFYRSWSCSFVTYAKARGHRASTRYVGGTKGRAFRRKGGKRFVKISLRELYSEMHCEVDQALYRERMAAQKQEA